jgi:hypothetical protein
MPFTVTYDREADCIRTRIVGRLDKELVGAFFAEVGRVASGTRCSRIISDLREAKIAASTLDIYGEVEGPEHTGIPRSHRRAIVISRDMRDYRFWETTCRNRGFLGVRIFTDYDQAAEWLLGG